MINTLADLKRYFSDNGAIKMTYHRFNDPNKPSKIMGVIRKPAKIQTNAVMFEGGSWLYYDKAECYQFTAKGFTVSERQRLPSDMNEATGELIPLLSYQYIKN